MLRVDDIFTCVSKNKAFWSFTALVRNDKETVWGKESEEH